MWMPQIPAAVFLLFAVAGAADAAARSSYRYYGPAPSLPRVRLREPFVPAPPVISNLPSNAIFSGVNQLDVYKYEPEPIPPRHHRYRPAKYYTTSVVPYLKYYLNAVTRTSKPTASYKEASPLPGLYGYEMRHYHPNEIDDTRHFRFVISARSEQRSQTSRALEGQSKGRGLQGITSQGQSKGRSLQAITSQFEKPPSEVMIRRLQGITSQFEKPPSEKSTQLVPLDLIFLLNMHHDDF